MIRNNTTLVHNLVKIDEMMYKDFDNFGYIKKGKVIYVRENNFKSVNSKNTLVEDAVIYECDIDSDPYSSLGNKDYEQVSLAKVMFHEGRALKYKPLFQNDISLDEALIILSISDEIHTNKFGIEEMNCVQFGGYENSTINAKYFSDLSELISNIRLENKVFGLKMKGLYTETEENEFGNTYRLYNKISGSLNINIFFNSYEEISKLIIIPEIISKQNYIPKIWGSLY